MAEPEHILEFVEQHIRHGLPLLEKKVLITAGPTHEAIDPVRFLGNRSTGTMGYELARKAVELGAEVILVSGPTALTIDYGNVKLIRVSTAEEMYNEVHNYFEHVDIAIGAAAVADYRPKTVAGQKIKKRDGEDMKIELERTKDILHSLGAVKKRQFLVGFALETENEEENAKGKLSRKNLDAIVLNSLNDTGAGFGTATNKITFLDKNSGSKTFDVKEKSEVASDIWNEIIQRIHA